MAIKETISSLNTLLLFVDASPSELFINDVDGKIVFTLSLFHPFDRRISILGQLKEVRKKRREVRIIEFIDLIEKGAVDFKAISIAVDKKLALLMAKDFLRETKLLTLDMEFSTQIDFFGAKITYGKLLCLAWYTICLYCYCTFAIKAAGKAQYPQVFALLDLLPGDSSERHRNLAIINLIAKHSELSVLNSHDLQENNVARFGYGYGYGIRYFKYDLIKYSHECCMTDWICHAVYNNFSKTPNALFSKLYNYLIEKEKLHVNQNHDFINFT